MKKLYFFEKLRKKNAFVLCFLFFVLVMPSMRSQAPGCPNVYAGEDVELDCETECTDLTATFLDTGATTSYIVESIPYDPPFPFTGLSNQVSVGADDVWSSAITLPFEFSYFGVNYSQVFIGSNGIISFNSQVPGGFCDWVLDAGELIPNSNIHQNAIMLFHDMDPRWGNAEIGYEVLGEYPCRTLVVSFANVHYYNFLNPTNGAISTFQMVLYETTNAIEFYVQSKPNPHNYITDPINGGVAVLGIQNNGGSQGYTPPGRNTSVWEAFDEAWRFSPNGSSIVDFAWLDEDDVIIGTTTTIEVCPTEEVTVYTARATYNLPTGDTIVVTDEVVVTSCVMVEPDCLRVDFIEDFSTGTGRHQTPYTDYNFQGVGQIDDGMYAISNTNLGPWDLNSGWHVGMEDHTPEDVDGMMLFVNADFDPGEFYRRTISLFPNIDYTFSAWITTVYDTDTNICAGTGNPSNVIFRIEDLDGNIIAETVTGDIPNGPDPNWQEFTVSFNTGDFTDVQVVLINNSIGGCGNDLALDDIAVYFQGDLPHAVAPEDLTQCDPSGETSVFDLTSQIPTILDGQNPDDFNVSFHLTEASASTNTNPISPEDAYTNTSNPQTIWVRVEKAELPSCFVIVNFDLIVTQGIEITTELPEMVEICEGDEFPSLDATPTNPDIDLELVTYEWYLEGLLISEEPVLTPSQAGVYTVIVTYDGCSTATFEIAVIVREKPLLDLGEDQLFCEGDSFEIIPFIEGAGDDITYLWNTGATTPTLVVSESGTYTLEISDGICTVSDSVQITFSSFPEVDLEELIYACPQENITLTAQTSAENATFTWYLNGGVLEGQTSNTITLTVDQTIVNTAMYILVEVNSNGCITTAESEITAYPSNPNCIITQGLSPDDTLGYNDFLDLSFLASRTGIANVQIMNRHGRLVYEKDNYVKEWRGQSTEGELLPTGTYYYVINLAGNDPVYGTQVTGWIYVNRK